MSDGRPPYRRSDKPGRRDSDFLFDSLCRRLETLDTRVGRLLERTDDQWRAAIASHDAEWRGVFREMQATMHRIRDQLDQRIDALEVLRHEDAARKDERTVANLAENEKRTRLAMRVGMIGGGFGILGTVVAALSQLHLL